jgi:hypothetical protein
MRLAAASLIVMLAAPAGPVPLQVPDDASLLPDDARDALGDRWPDWELASAVASCEAGPLQRVVPFDADGDGRQDVAVAVRAADAVHVAIFLNRPWGYILHDVDALPGATGALSLGVAQAGDRFKAQGRTLADFFSNATLVVSTCEGTLTGYLWNGVRFEKTPLELQTKP